LTTLAPPRTSRVAGTGRVRAALARLDWVLLAAVVAVTAFGLFVIREATRSDVPGDPDFFLMRQSLYVLLGVLLMVGAFTVDLARIGRWAWALWGGLLGALAVVFVVGSAVRGSNRWIELGPINVQPSELGKVLMIVVLAGLVAERRSEIARPRFSLFIAGVAAVPAVVVFLQPDLGTALVYGAVLAAILFLAGAPWPHFAVFGAVVLTAILAVLWILPAVGVQVLQPYQLERLTAFVGATRESSDAGYQLDQSKTAVGSGGTIGKGPDGATQTVNHFLPEHHTDFIFAVASEMFGFVGGAGLILLYCLIIWRGLRAMARASTSVDQLVAGGIVAMIAFQVFVNIGMTVGLMPITGIPLPLMSFGGSHMLTTFIAFGLLLGIHQRRAPAVA
jgi:rod shape determining protein RodA